MHVISRKLNHRNIRLEHDTEHENVGVMDRDGKVHQLRWLGFITRPDAKRVGKPVKLQISRADSIDLEPGQFVLGCLVERGVYAVLDSSVAVIGSEAVNP